MDQEMTVFLGKLLGETYSLRKELTGGCRVSDEKIFGLLNGFEATINDEIVSVGFVSADDERHVALEGPADEGGKGEALRGTEDRFAAQRIRVDP